jgi:hypothetical protein
MKFKNAITGQIVEAQNWQLKLKAGDYYMIKQPPIFTQNEKGQWEEHRGPTIYGEIITNEPEEDEPPYQPGFFLVRGYSQWAPTGELGEFCIIDATYPLTKEQFDAARAAGWPIHLPPLNTRGPDCPTCGSDNTKWLNKPPVGEIGSGPAYIRCLECGREWDEDGREDEFYDED